MDHSNHSTTADYAYYKLRKGIILKTFKAGERLSEIGLAEKLEVSRTPVREAIRRLASDGLVVLVPNSGMWVASPGYQEMLDTCEVREYLECLSVERAAKRITPQHICRLEEKVLDEEDAFAARDVERYLEANASFHRILAEAGGNSVLAECVERLLARTFVFVVLCDSYFEETENPSLDAHRALLATLRAGNADKCVSIMRDHIQASADELRRAWDRQEGSKKA